MAEHSCVSRVAGREVLKGIVPLWLLCASDGLSAQALEEVVVTAQKREQNLQDVPISITAISGEGLREGGLSRLEDMAAIVPNFSFTEAVSGSDNMYMRGVGSGINYGFEQAVGQVIDGFFYGRSRFGRAAFLDVERVEVLKGPQGALIGKNTSAGAISITTAKPTREFEAWGTGTWEFDGSEGFNVEGALSGPLGETFSARLAFRYDGRDGYVRNVAADRDEQSLDDLTIRTTFVWDATDSFDATLTYQYGDFQRSGRTTQLSKCGAALRNFDPDGPGPAPAGALFNLLVSTGEDCEANYRHNVVLTRNGQPEDQAYDTEFNLVGLTLNWSLANDHTLTSLTGYSNYDSLDNFEVDFTYAPIAAAYTTEDYRQWSQELRITSPLGQKHDYLFGVYLLATEHDVSFRRDFIALPPPLTPAGNLIATSQDAETYAVFGQYTRHINDAWDLTVSARYTHEEKDATQVQTPTVLHTNTPTLLVPPAGPAAAVHAIAGERSEDNFSPVANVLWRPNDGAMVYASVARGFKGGGFDMQNDGFQQKAEDSFEFDDENVTAYEIGAKLTLPGGAARLNVALFRSEFDDLQVSTIDSTSTTFNVGNAASAVSQGFEADLDWIVTERLVLNANFAWLDSEYDEFPDAPCNYLQISSGTCTGVGQTTDLGGQELPFAPEISAMGSAEYTWPFGNGLELTAWGQVVYSDEFALVLDLDPNTYQDSFTKFNARLSLRNAARSWELSLIGRNLSDETTRSFSNDGLGGPFMAGSYFSMVDAPRSIALQGTVRY